MTASSPRLPGATKSDDRRGIVRHLVGLDLPTGVHDEFHEFVIGGALNGPGIELDLLFLPPASPGLHPEYRRRDVVALSRHVEQRVRYLGGRLDRPAIQLLAKMLPQRLRIDTKMNGDVRLRHTKPRHRFDCPALLVRAEVIRTKVAIIEGLEARIKSRERENSIRDYLAKSPWLISPRRETYKREISLNIFLEEAHARAGIVEKDPRWAGRMDLVLTSDGHILVLEFMRPKLSVDGDHLQRFQTYVDTLRVRVKVNTSLGIHTISGLLVADKLATTADDQPLIERLAAADMRCA
jgi:hypothetical protein